MEPVPAERVDWPAAVAGRTITGSAVVHLADRNVLPLTWASQGGHSHPHPTMLGSFLDHPDQKFATLIHPHKEVVSTQGSMVVIFESVPMMPGQMLKVKIQDYAKVHLYMQRLFDEGSDLAGAKVVEEQQAFAEQGVGLVVVEHPAVLVAWQVAVVGLVVLPAVYYQQGYMAQLAVAHPHQTTILLPEGCFPHLGTHAQFVCGQDFYCLDNVET